MLGENRTALSELTDTITDTVDQIELGEAVSRLTDVAGTGIELVAPVAARGVDAARDTARHPAKILGAIGIVVVVVALVYWLTNRGDDRPDPSDHPGVV